MKASKLIEIIEGITQLHGDCDIHVWDIREECILKVDSVYYLEDNEIEICVE